MRTHTHTHTHTSFLMGLGNEAQSTVVSVNIPESRAHKEDFYVPCDSMYVLSCSLQKKGPNVYPGVPHDYVKKVKLIVASFQGPPSFCCTKASQ